MRKTIILFFLLSNIFCNAQEASDSLRYFPWKKIVLQNEATLKNHYTLNWGAGFLIKYHNDTIAITARDIINTYYNNGNIIPLDSFCANIKTWKMYVSDNPSEYVLLDTIFNKNRIEKKKSIFTYNAHFLSFAIKEKHKEIIPLTPNIEKIRDKDTLFIVGYDNDHNIKFFQGQEETALHEKYETTSVRIKVDDYIFYKNLIGAPIINKKGEVIAFVSRIFSLKKDKKGRIINNKKNIEGSYFDNYIYGITMRTILGKKYCP